MKGWEVVEVVFFLVGRKMSLSRCARVKLVEMLLELGIHGDLMPYIIYGWNRIFKLAYLPMNRRLTVEHFQIACDMNGHIMWQNITNYNQKLDNLRSILRCN